MKPSNDYQRKVVALSERLPGVTKPQMDWAVRSCFNIDGYHNKKTAWCSHCGTVSKGKFNENTLQMVCPVCGKKLKLEYSKKTVIKESWYCTFLTTCKGFQVCRHFIVDRIARKRSKPQISINEVVQNWIDQEGKETVLARNRLPFMLYYDKWDFGTPLSIKRKRNYFYISNLYDINSCFLYPRSKVLPIVRRNGYKITTSEIAPNLLIKMLLTDKEAEMLVKNNQFKLLLYKSDKGLTNLPYPHSVRIANKNRYIVNDASMWFDYLELLSRFNKDTHNSFYVCPDDLEREHDKLVVKRTRIEQKIELIEKRKQSKAYEEAYKASKGRFFDVKFSNDNIKVSVIQSVAEMAEEGLLLHHCVFVNEYYKKDKSLILSAKDMNGNRLETIEVSLETYKVIQSRGICNKSTELHNEIVGLINENMNLIRNVV